MLKLNTTLTTLDITGTHFVCFPIGLSCHIHTPFVVENHLEAHKEHEISGALAIFMALKHNKTLKSLYIDAGVITARL